MIGVVGVTTGQVEHPLDTQLLIEPGADLGVKNGDGTGALARGWFLVERLTQHPGNRVAVMTEKVGNLDIGPAFVVEQRDG